jgi:hypothetical protein
MSVSSSRASASRARASRDAVKSLSTTASTPHNSFVTRYSFGTGTQADYATIAYQG